jgi:hypothetical protein
MLGILSFRYSEGAIIESSLLRNNDLAKGLLFQYIFFFSYRFKHVNKQNIIKYYPFLDKFSSLGDLLYSKYCYDITLKSSNVFSHPILDSNNELKPLVQINNLIFLKRL